MIVRSVLAAGLAVASHAFAPLPATAGVKVDGAYEISIAGWRLAQAKVNVSVDGGRYEADLFMQPKGVATIVTAVRTSVDAKGRLRGGQVLPTHYSVRADEIDRPVRVSMRMNGGSVTSLSAQPPLKKKMGRVPITNAHRRGIVDPMSSGLIPAKAADARDACNHTMKIFDGWTRYDVRLSYKGTRNVSTQGFSGKGAVCAARWVPVAGHRPEKKEVQYLARNRALEVTVVKLPGEPFAIPYEVRIGTPNGEIKVTPSRLSISGAGS